MLKFLAAAVWICAATLGAVFYSFQAAGSHGDDAKPTATKIIIPFDRKDLGLGGQSVFVGQRGWADLIIEACNASSDMSRDLNTLRLIDSLPSLDPFLLREHLRRHGHMVGNCYFALSPADWQGR